MTESTATDQRALFWLGRAGDNAGSDLHRALMEGVILPDDYARTVARCQSCSSPTSCQAWLAANETVAPGTCRNAPLIAELRAK